MDVGLSVVDTCSRHGSIVIKDSVDFPDVDSCCWHVLVVNEGCFDGEVEVFDLFLGGVVAAVETLILIY